MSKFNDCFQVVLEHEGGYTDDPTDPGGPTNWGVALNEDGPALTRLLGHAPTVEDIKSLTQEQAGVIFKQNYWGRMRLDEVNSEKVCMVLFDMGVLCGVGGASRRAQTVVGLDIDGSIGANTLRAINALDESAFCERFLELSEDYFRSRAANNPQLRVFLQGWLNRCESLKNKVGVS